ncbi:bile acid:sodium symporter family protein [Indioceanicola profundi]|uniref:bile acid:sodium symporter family protein n=1 Tax=Indioceanicola profundi TaxID=2220096 RepID=UPI000E6ACD39|nr:bile acid:sodium symporter family protein [Indioceanicola profundi]
MRFRLPTSIIDPFLLLLLLTAGLAALYPMTGQAARTLDVVTDLAIALLFFLHGAKLSRDAILAGIGHWRLHLTVLSSTFIVFPLLGLSITLLSPALVAPAIAAGFLYLCVLPSTVQSSIAFTSTAGGNVPAAICSASLSNLLGMFLTPLFVAMLLQPEGSASAALQLGAIQSILLQLLVPFMAGHLLRPWIGGVLERAKAWTGYTDRLSILLVVYSAFGAATLEGLWTEVEWVDLGTIIAGSVAILAIVIAFSTWIAVKFGFSRPDRIALVFCGSKKSLVSGVPMARVLFPAAQVGVIILPLMIFHQLQLILCAWLASRYRRQGEYSDATALSC